MVCSLWNFQLDNVVIFKFWIVHFGYLHKWTYEEMY